MLKRVSVIAIVGLLPLVLSGCLWGQHGMIHDRSNDYLKSQSEPALKMPPKVQLVDHEPAYPIPEGKTIAQAVSILPPGFDADSHVKAAATSAAPSFGITQADNGVVQLRLENVSPALAWESVTTGVKKMGYQIIGSDQKNGIIEISGKVSSQYGAEVYQVNVVSQPTTTVISIRDQNGEPVDAATATRILDELKIHV